MVLFILTLIISSPMLLEAQPDTAKFFNYYWEETSRDSAQYYRTIQPEEKYSIVKDYYISGRIQMEGNYSSLEPEIQHGYFKWYYENGQKFVEGEYKFGQRDGIWTFWFPDGLKKEEMRFTAGKKDEFIVKWRSKRLQSSESLIKKANSKSENKNFDKAEQLLNEALGINPFSAEALYERGRLKMKRDELDNACQDWIKAREFGFYDSHTLNKIIDEHCAPDK